MTTAAGSRTRSAGLTAIIGVGFLLFVFPLYWLFISATHSSGDIFATPPNLLPGSFLWRNLTSLFADREFGRAVANSLIVSTIFVLLGMLLCVMGGYAFAKFDFKGRKAMFAVVIATLAVPFPITVVPLFQTMVELGWLDTYQALILPNLAYPFGLFLMRQAMQAVPDELIQAARVDGAGEFAILVRIVVPTMLPALATLAIFLFLGSWNDFMWPLVALRTEPMYTIPVALASYQSIGSTEYGPLIAATAVSVIPVAVVFIAFQRYFVAGLVSGAVKQ